jgi:hypothetical protein
VTVCLALVATTGGLGAARASAQVLPIHDVQFTTDPSGDSPYLWQVVSLEGVVTGTTFYGFTIADAPGAWNGIFVADYTIAPEVGDLVAVTGLVYEDFGMTMIVEVSEIELFYTDLPAPATVIPVSDVAQEAWESVLVQVEDVYVGALLDYGEWAVTDWVGFALVDDLRDYVYFPRELDFLDSLTGIVYYTFGDFKIEPRDTSDIVTDLLPHYLLRGDVVTMNDAREVLPDRYVEIHGDLIAGIHETAPAGLDVVDTGGLIFPGLIDAHNHPRYNVLDLIPFGQTFEERYEWQATQMNSDFGDQYRGILHYGYDWSMEANMVKVAELRAMAAGTTTMQGINCNESYHSPFAHQGMGIDNAERYPSLVFSSVFPLEIPLQDWALIAGENWQRFAIHLSEGINADALTEFHIVAGTGLLDWRTTIIHGVPYGDPEWSTMAAADAHLVWSPMSNWQLYGETAAIPGALAAGVNVALAPDWTPSGAGHVMGELQFSAAWDEIFWGDTITPLAHVEQATRNAALALANEERLGQVTPGFRANLTVVPGNPAAPYEALLAAHPGTVKLTVVDGRPMYGDLEFADALDLLGPAEEVEICATPKLFSVTVDSHSIDEAAKPVAQILGELEFVYGEVEPKVSDLYLLADTTEPRLMLEGPLCAPWGGRSRPQLEVHAFDDCGAPQISIDGIVLRNGDGEVVNGFGVVALDGARIVVDANGAGWSIEATATAVDSSGNAAAETWIYGLPKCR